MDQADILSADLLSDLLNGYADDGCPSCKAIISLAQSALASNDPSVRSAAARALSAADPKDAREKLPTLIESESNSFSKAIMVGALRATEL